MDFVKLPRFVYILVLLFKNNCWDDTHIFKKTIYFAIKSVQKIRLQNIFFVVVVGFTQKNLFFLL